MCAFKILINSKPIKRHVRLYNSGDFDRLNTLIHKYDWSFLGCLFVAVTFIKKLLEFITICISHNDVYYETL